VPKEMQYEVVSGGDPRSLVSGEGVAPTAPSYKPPEFRSADARRHAEFPHGETNGHGSNGYESGAHNGHGGSHLDDPDPTDEEQAPTRS